MKKLLLTSLFLHCTIFYAHEKGFYCGNPSCCTHNQKPRFTDSCATSNALSTMQHYRLFAYDQIKLLEKLRRQEAYKQFLVARIIPRHLPFSPEEYAKAEELRLNALVAYATAKQPLSPGRDTKTVDSTVHFPHPKSPVAHKDSEQTIVPWHSLPRQQCQCENPARELSGWQQYLTLSLKPVPTNNL